MDAALPCAASGCTRPADPVLCPPHTRQAGDMLAQLGTEYELLSAAPSLQAREPGTGRAGGLASHRAPGSTHTITLRSRARGTGRIGWGDADECGLDDTPSVFETLHTYARMVRDQRDLALPTVDLAYVRAARPAGPVCDPHAPRCGHHTCEVWTFRATVTPPVTVLTERALLAAHLDWIVGQPWVGEFFDEIRALHGLLRSANGHSAPRPGYTAHCDCGGRIRWVQGAATCQACGTSVVTAATLRRHAGQAA